jgi:predicted amidohydrolase YtcJ
VAAFAFVGGRVLTMEPGAEPDVVIVEGDRIAAVGPRLLLDSRADAEVVDLGGRTLLPGFIDAHNHLSMASLQPRWADLTEAEDPAGIRAALVEHAGREPEATWIRGFGWSTRRDFPLSRHDLDDLGLDRPVLVTHFSLHQAVTDSRGSTRCRSARAPLIRRAVSSNATRPAGRRVCSSSAPGPWPTRSHWSVTTPQSFGASSSCSAPAVCSPMDHLRARRRLPAGRGGHLCPVGVRG